jgi:hypothetical protein
MSRSLGVLTLDLVARVGGFTGAMDKAGRSAEQNAKRMEAAAKKSREEWVRFGKVAGAAIAGLATGVFVKFIAETRAAEQEQAQLAAVLQSTGEAAGFSQGTLNEMADTLEAISTFSAGDITEAQTALLAFTGIVGDEFPRALQAATDMATRTGTSVVQAAETIGRALDVPSKGMAALSKQGFRFTEDQKKVVAQLEATGRSAEAQGIILEALESTYGGAAEAARDTFGGALTALSNTIDYLLTGEDGSLASATEAINKFNETLRDPSTKEAVDATVSGLANLANRAVDLGKEFIGLGEVASQTFNNIMGNTTAAEDIQYELDTIDRALNASSFNNKPIQFLFTSEEDLQKLREQKAELLATLQIVETPVEDPLNLDKINKGLDQMLSRAGLFAGLEGNTFFDEEAILAAAKATEEAAKQQEALNRSYDTQVARFQEQIALTGEVTELEKIRYAITSGALVGINAEQQARLEGLAAEIDAQEQLSAIELDRAEQAEELAAQYQSVREGLLTQEERFNEAAAERYETLRAAREQGLISEQEFTELSAKSTEALNAQIEGIKEKTGELDEFTKNAARSIQSEISDALGDAFTGSSKDILSDWGDLLNKMVRDAIAADITRSLFGQDSSTGFGTGQLMSGLGSLFAGFFDAGGNIPSGKFGIVGERGPEIVSGPATVTGRIETNRVMSSGGGQQMITNNLTVQGRIDRRTEGQIAREIAQQTRKATARG